MSSATLPNSNRLRQIAILVSSVDAAAARQLLLHLPTEMAKQVRGMVNKLGPISPAEKRAILAEFQKSAGEGGSRSTPQSNLAQPSLVSRSDPSISNTIRTDPGASGRPPSDATAADAALSQIATHSSDATRLREIPTGLAAEPDNSPAWTKLSTEALVRFVQGERTAVIAVVVSQLLPHKAVDVLRQLPRDAHRAVLQRLSQLQDIDPNAMKAIDDHLAERLSDYQHRIESELENSRRLSALLSAAPADLQLEWRELLQDDNLLQVGSSSSSSKSMATPTPFPVAKQNTTRATIAELYGDAVLTTVDAAAQVASPQPGESESPADRIARAMNDDESTVLPFAPRQEPNPPQSPAVKIPTKHIQFGEILSLSPQDLAGLLSSLDSETVLLALAGSTPEFMQKFSRLLSPRDMKALKKQLDLLGAINLRDVDEAQHRVVERAERMLATRASSVSQRRQAA